MKSIGVVIPVFNQGEYLNDALRSIMDNGNRFDVQVAIVDDKSTDASLNIIKELQVAYLGKLNIKILEHEVNKGLSAARNTGIACIDTDYIVCLDADDRLHFNYFNRCYTTMIKEKVDIVYADAYLFGSQHGVYRWPDFDIMQFRYGNFVNCSAMFKRNVWVTIGKFDENMHNGWEDYEFWIRAYKAGFKFAKSPDTRLWWRQKESSMNTELNADKEKKEAIKKYINSKHEGWFRGE